MIFLPDCSIFKQVIKIKTSYVLGKDGNLLPLSIPHPVGNKFPYFPKTYEVLV